MSELNIDNESVILNKYNINPNELYVIKCILYMFEEEDKYIKSYLQLPEEVRGNFSDILISLKNKHIILSTYKVPNKGESFDLTEIPFSKNFLKDYYRSSFELGNELFEVYPKFGNINGSIVSLRTVASKFNSLEDAFRRYGKEIHYKEKTHKEIVELVKWAKSNDVLKIGFAAFIINQSWIDLKELRDGNIGKYNLNAVKLL